MLLTLRAFFDIVMVKIKRVATERIKRTDKMRLIDELDTYYGNTIFGDTHCIIIEQVFPDHHSETVYDGPTKDIPYYLLKKQLMGSKHSNALYMYIAE